MDSDFSDMTTYVIHGHVNKVKQVVLMRDSFKYPKTVCNCVLTYKSHCSYTTEVVFSTSLTGFHCELEMQLSVIIRGGSV